MGRIIKTLLLAILFFAITVSCKKKKVEIPPPEPTIELVSVTPVSAKQFVDTIIILLKYKDVNGDIGDLNPDDLSLRIKDSRLPNPDWYHVQPLAPMNGEDIDITGQIRVRLNSLFLMGTGNSEVMTFSIKVKDRAGNWSNEIASPEITINK